jgi:hypothetical protein
MGVVSACAFSFMSKYLHQSWGQKPMTRVDINDNNQSSNRHNCKIVCREGEIFGKASRNYPREQRSRETLHFHCIS